MWLDECMKDFDGPYCNVGARKSGRRMARVIREQNEVIVHAHALTLIIQGGFDRAFLEENHPEATYEDTLIRLNEALKDMIESMSDDAKELLGVD